MTPAALVEKLRSQGHEMSEDEARAALDGHVAAGFMVDNGDGSYSPTDLGRVVAKGSGSRN